MMTKAYFPMETLRVTQGYGVAYQGQAANTYSHTGSYALDLGGVDGGQDWLYAPFDCKVLRVYGAYNSVWFESLDVVDTVGSKVIMQCLHMNDSDKSALGIAVGKVFRQGEKCYREGTAGNATGNHVHLEVGKSPFTGTGWHKNASGVWEINDKLIPSEVFTLRDNCHVVNDGGYNWNREQSVSVLSEEPVRMECTASKAADVAKICGILAELWVGYSYTDGVIRTTGKVSKGDQYLIIRDSGAEWRVAEDTDVLNKEGCESCKVTAEQLEQLRAVIAKIREALND